MYQKPLATAVLLVLGLAINSCASFSIGIPNAENAPAECRNEKHRPQLHFTPKANWINDPNGMVYYDGEYHLYFQYTPNSAHSGAKYWGHAVSTDLSTWTELDIALYPDEMGDMWSGSAVVDFKNASGFQTDPNIQPIVAFFTHAAGPAPQQQSIAYSNDKGRTFTKFAGNPVIANPGRGDFRDPKVIQFAENSWVLVLATGDRVQFYTSTDLKKWDLASEFGAEPLVGNHGGTWECPELLRIETQGYESWVLLVSNFGGYHNPGSGTQYFVGSFDGTTFHSDQVAPLYLDWGFDNYASVSFSNEPKNRHILMGWMTNLMYAEEIPTGDYRGQITLPRDISLVAVDGHLRLKSVIPEEFFNSLRNPSQSFAISSMTDIPPNQQLNVSDAMPFSNSLLEVDLAFNIHEIRGPSSIAICFLNSLNQELCVGYDHEREAGTEIFLNREKTGNLGAISGSFAGRATAGRETGDAIITFKIILDVSAVEMFVDGGLTVMTALFYPDEPLTRVEIRHHAFHPESKVTLISGSVRGINSMYDC
nr:putative GH32 family protein [Dicyrtomina minuta]